MDINTNFAEQVAQSGTRESPRHVMIDDEGAAITDDLRAYELGTWLSAVRSFLNLRNHPLAETDRAEILRRDFVNEARIAQRVLLRCSQLVLELVHSDAPAPFEESEEAEVSDILPRAERHIPVSSDLAQQSLIVLAEALSDAHSFLDALLEERVVSFRHWSAIRKFLTRSFDHSDTFKYLVRVARYRASANLQPALLTLTERLTPDALGRDMRVIFADLACLLERLRFIEGLLQRDYPLKQTLPIFTLVHEEARVLIDFIEVHVLRMKGLDETVLDTVDGTSYAIGMELCKVFTYELVGLAELRPVPPIYIKVDSAYGLLLNSFQQSTIALAQVFDPTLAGVNLFNFLHLKLEQSVRLRRDLWALLQHVRRAAKERDQLSTRPLLERLIEFRDGSLRYVMYKDWEAFERFIEEAAMAHGATELMTVLHRLDTYLETLLGQINMRTVLADMPFDYPALED